MLKKKPMNRTLTEPGRQKKMVPKCNHSSASLNRQLSVMEGGSCPSSPQVKKAYRLVVLGSAQTGKTCVVNRFLNDAFDDSYLPTIENFHRKLYRIHGEFYQLDILDTSGNDPFPAARRLSLLTGDLFLVVFSVDKPSSFEEIFRLREQILEAKDDSGMNSLPNGRSKVSISSLTASNALSVSTSSGSHRIPMAIAANKIDLPSSKHAVNVDEIRSKITNLPNCAFVECSAKTGENIDDLFAKLFALAKLPKQMSPGQHRHVGLEKSLDSALPTHASQSVPLVDPPNAENGRKKSSMMRLRSKHSEPAVAFDAEARRPSLRTDLMLLRAKQSTTHQPNLAALNAMTNGGHFGQANTAKSRKCVIQ